LPDGLIIFNDDIISFGRQAVFLYPYPKFRLLRERIEKTAFSYLSLDSQKHIKVV